LSEFIIILAAAILGSVVRVIFGFLGEAEPNEDFSWKKALRSIVRGVIGGAVIGVYCFYTQLITNPLGVFLATFTGAITVDLIVKNIGDMTRKA